jgi:hypothetical protein
MSCHLCNTELEFHEIAGYNPNLPPYSEDRTNFCWEDEEQTTTAPICDSCYWAEGSVEDELEDDDEEEELPVYSFCRDCSNPIEQICIDGLDDEEINEAMYNNQCTDCLDNPSTPPKSTSRRNGSPSALQAVQSPSSQP